MFKSNSRYANNATIEATLDDGTTCAAVKFRRLPRVGGVQTTVTTNDRLDIIAHQHYGDSTKFWHIADANTELEAKELVSQSGRTIWIPSD